MPLPTRITLPPSGRPVGGLLAAARPLEGEWWRGVTVASGQCLVPQNYGPCASDEATQKVDQDLSDAAEFLAFTVLQAVRCSTMGRTAVDNFANEALDVTREYGVALELLGGAATGNPSLSVGPTTTLTAAADPITALACIDQAANTELSGRTAFIHTPAGVGTHLLAAGAIWKDGRLWRTASGNVVVISPAYDGRAPGGSAPTAGQPLYMYATGEVSAATGQREVLQSVERSQNTAQATAEDAAIVVFDPCFVVAIDSGINAC
jgi:hypothetical protein